MAARVYSLVGPVYEVGDVKVSCPRQLQEYVESRAGVVRGTVCDMGGADSLPVRPCEGLCARQEGRPNNSPPTVKFENKTTRRRYQERKIKECRNRNSVVGNVRKTSKCAPYA